MMNRYASLFIALVLAAWAGLALASWAATLAVTGALA